MTRYNKSKMFEMSNKNQRLLFLLEQSENYTEDYKTRLWAGHIDKE